MLVPIAAIVIGAIGLSREPAGRNYSTWASSSGLFRLPCR
jgi:hypothetical protein